MNKIDLREVEISDNEMFDMNAVNIVNENKEKE